VKRDPASSEEDQADQDPEVEGHRSFLPRPGSPPALRIEPRASPSNWCR
jgi:hypothetical protein